MRFTSIFTIFPFQTNKRTFGSNSKLGKGFFYLDHSRRVQLNVAYSNGNSKGIYKYIEFISQYGG